MTSSDHKQPSTKIAELLPEVYRSNVTQTVMSTAFDRFLTKDDTVRIAGYIGQGNPNARISRQVKELTPHRQAYQLAPTMVSKVGAETSALSFKAFQTQLELMGVDLSKMEDWASTLRFNWVPPVNLDMLVNYSDYYWVPKNRGDVPQYFTIEDPCDKATAAAYSFMTTIGARGLTHTITSMDIVANQMVISAQMSDVFTSGFEFRTINASQPRMENAMWTVDTSTYDPLTNRTTVTVIEPIASVTATAPSAPEENDWWFSTTDNRLRNWSGTTWDLISTTQAITATLQDALTRFQMAASCACDQDFGWDTTPWDTTAWDYNEACAAPALNAWSETNQWIHKSEVQSLAGATRASVPILEYASHVEMNSWVRRDRQWKYRSAPQYAFEATTSRPSRFELEPIKGYVVSNAGGVWRLYLFSQSQTMNRDIDYSGTFVPGYRFAIRDDSGVVNVYTVAEVEYRQLSGSEPANVVTIAGTGYMCTVVTLADATFNSQAQGGGIDNARVEPLVTSLGDVWGGYHANWCVDVETVTSVPVENQMKNLFATLDEDGAATYNQVTSAAAQAGGTTFQPASSGLVLIGNTFQQNTVLATGVTYISIIDKFRYNAAAPSFYATPNSDDLRVYVNGVRQYLNYVEHTAVGLPNYTVVGNAVTTSQPIPFVTGITFNTELQVGDIVRIEVGPAAYSDMGWYAVPVRTVEDEVAFTIAVADGTQPVYTGMSLYARSEQQKTVPNQYPQFNMYDLIDGTVVGASPLFAFQEGEQYPITPAVQRRIAKDATGKEFGFVQYLVDRSDNEMYGYRNVTQKFSYWYNPLTDVVKRWVNDTWTTNFIMTLPDGSMVLREAVTSPIEPIELHEVDRAVWYNTTTDKLYYYDLASSQWIEMENVVVNSGDPSLMTIWRHGTNNEQAVPQYVDANREPVAIGSPEGDWGVIDQWMYNSEHKNYKFITFSQMVSHFSSIIDAQPPVPGLPGNGAFTLMHNQYNYGLGGTIHEHNDSFDTLISAVNVTNVTPIGVIENAQREYANCLLFTRDLFNRMLPTLLQSVETATFVDNEAIIAAAVIDAFEANDYYAQLYGDSSAYDPVTKKGIRNWIATAPMFGLTELTRPYTSTVGSVINLMHHDGHRSQVTYTAAEQDRVARTVIAADDNRVANGKLGKTSFLPAPAQMADFYTEFGLFRTGVYWYQTVSGTRTLYRLSAYAISDIAPPTVTATGAAVPVGTMYYNTISKNVFRFNGTAWIAITPANSSNIAPLWVAVDMVNLLGQTTLEIEQRLYDVTPALRQVFDYSTLQSSSTIDQYNDLMKDRFITYVTNEEIRQPFVNTLFNATDPYSWNYKMSVPLNPPANISVESAASWQELYLRWYNTPYPHLEPWKIQGYHNKPMWWDSEYADTSGTRRWTSAMWTNLLNRIIPAGRAKTNGELSDGFADTTLVQYQYFSVNTSTDQLYPPYYEVVGATVDRSLFADYSEIIASNADYVFGDVGPVEWQWSQSAQRPYDDAIVAFQMQPAKFLHAAFGPQYAIIDELQVDSLFKQVYSHEDALFYGDIYDTDKSYYVRGLNQWYVNYNRYTGYDTNGEFRQLWAGWDPKMTHQFGGIIDTSTFEITNKAYDVIPADYQIILANSGVIRDTWVDAFNVSLISIPPALVQYNNQAAWKMEVNTLAAIPREITYYGTKTYPFTANHVTDEFVAFNYKITAVEHLARRFYVVGDQTDAFREGRQFQVSGSSTNNGIYTVVSAVFDLLTSRTRVNTIETPATSFNEGTADGFIDIIDVVLPWEFGAQIVVSSTKFLPAPLLPDTPYFIIPTGDRSFRLAETYNDAITGTFIDIISAGDGSHTVAQLDSSFFVFGGQGTTGDRWYHYALDKNDIRTFTPPFPVQGMQSLIDMIDGYSAYQKDTQNLLYGPSFSEDVDADTGRQVDWSVETERFINWAFSLRQSRMATHDSYEVQANTITSTLTFIGSTPFWRSGTMVSLRSSGTLPAPLLPDSPYYVVTTGTVGQIRLSLSANALDLDAQIEFTTTGTGVITIGQFDRQRAYPSFEMNPTRNNVFLNTPTGVLANVIEGPYTDIRVQQTIFDQYNRPLTADNLSVFRMDNISHLTIVPELKNDVDVMYDGDPYNYIHIGGAHLFVEAYEHYLIFNDYTVGGALVYDQFYGLWTKRFEVDYYEKEDYTLRPTLGGYYLINGQFRRNIEGSVVDMSEYYDTSALSELSQVAQYARRLLGYEGKTDYMNLVGANSKSQFLFYKGMIQSKGSMNSVHAYTNSRRFVDASIDEFWAWKIADFGDNRPKVYPEIKLFSTDSTVDDVRLEFLAASDVVTDPEYVEAVDNGFQLVSFADDSRWNNFPEQRAEIQTPLFLDAEVTNVAVIFAGIAPPPPGAEVTVQYWLDTAGVPVLKKYDASATPKWVATTELAVTVMDIVVDGEATQVVYVKHNQFCDDVRVLRRNVNTLSHTVLSADPESNTLMLAGDVANDFVAGESFVLTPLAGPAAAYTTASAMYDGATTTLFVSTEAWIPSFSTGGVITVSDFADYTTEILIPGTGLDEYTKVNSETVRFNSVGFRDIIIVFTVNPSKAKLNPAKLIDTLSSTVVQQMPLWHPALGFHSPIAIHNVDLQHAGDPARYQFTPNQTAPNNSGNFWNQSEKNTVWLDTSYLGYIPYYDDKVYPEIDDRLYKWGKLAPWGDVRAYQWVESTVPPDQWDAAVVEQANNALIPQNEKATGTPYMIMSKRTRARANATATNDYVTVPAGLFEVNDMVLFTTDGTLPAGLEAGAKYVIGGTDGGVSPNVNLWLMDVVTEDRISIGGEAFDLGSGQLYIVPAFTSDMWIENALITQRMTAPTVLTEAYKYITQGASSVPPLVNWDSTVVDMIAWTPVTMSDWEAQANQTSPTNTTVVDAPAPDAVDVYVNGIIAATGLVVRQRYVTGNPTAQLFVQLEAGGELELKEHDIVDIVRPIHTLTPDEEAFDPDATDDGTVMVQWKFDYQYSTQTVTSGSNIAGYTPTTYYYFWVRQTTTRSVTANSNLSAFEVENQLRSIPTSYFVIQRPKDDPYLLEKYGYGIIQYGSIWSLGVLSESMYEIPVQYRQAIVRKVSTYLKDGDRFIVKFTRDWTLRDDLTANGKSMNLKDRHEEWQLFRRQQQGALPRALWDRLTEAVVGYKDATVAVYSPELQKYVMTPTKQRVPSLNRQLYDEANGTDTQYGLGVDQAFVNRTYAMATILGYLTNPDYNFWPLNIDAFFASNTFDTPEGTKKAMDEIYDTFAAEHINGIWFDTLADAMATKAKYKELLKTSWVALHGVRLLDVGGAFDD